MARAELGTKRTDPENGKKFYDFGKDPIVSPYTGTSYPLAFFEPPAAPSKYGRSAPKPVLREEPAEDEAEAAAPEGDDEDTVSLSDVEEEEGAAVSRGGARADDDVEDDEQSDDDAEVFALDEEPDDVEDLVRERDEDED